VVNAVANNKGSAVVSFEELMKRSDLQQQVVHVPRWDIDVTITELSVEDIQHLRDKAAGPDGEFDADKFGVYLLVTSIIAPVRFTIEEMQALAKKSQVPLLSLVNAITKLNGLGDQGALAAENSFPAKG
jgi:hypothetical protein